MKKSITLIGMPGVGKSSIGRLLAGQIGSLFLDLDHVLCQKFQTETLLEVVEDVGEEAFLVEEEKAALSVSFEKPLVLSPGGSMVYSSSAMTYFKRHSQVVFLKDEIASIMKRIKNGDKRGIVWQGAESLAQLLDHRQKLYEQYADLVYDCGTRLSLKEHVEALIQKLGLK